MESRDCREETLTSRPRSSTSDDDVIRWRLWLGVWSLCLVALSFLQAPGRIVTDTKLDLTADPWGFLERALSAWDPNGALGQLQNQAYGYLFPMGPFFGVGDWLGLEPWVTQRLWWSLVLVVAFLGAARLSGLLGVRSGWVRIVVGLAFALSPRMMSVIGASSIEVWPSAVAPWVLIPLVMAARTGRVRSGAAWSALAVACVGGVNAAATFAVIPLGAWWILTRPAGPRRRALMLWWPACVLLGTLWWIIPLFVLGSYSPPFLDLIESSSNASLAATAYDALRGTSNWVSYVDANVVAGQQLITNPVVILNSVVVLVVGAIGLALRGTPHRRFLIGGVLLGLLAVTAGHASELPGWGSDAIGDLLDGVLAPLRNTHKFDVLIRLPLVLGVGFVLQQVVDARQRDTKDATAAAQFVGVCLLVIAALWGATAPAWSASLAPERSYEEIPDYWDETAAWLDEHANGGTLVAPATAFGDYLWGKTADEPIQALTDQTSWIVRNVVPLTPTGTIETLDEFSAQFATGQGSAEFAESLQRAGIGTVVVRHDIQIDSAVISPELVRATLMSTPGVTLTAEFGPTVGGEPTIETEDGRTAFINGGWRDLRSAVEVFTLEADVPQERWIDLESTPTVIGDVHTVQTLDRFGFARLGSEAGQDVVIADAETTADSTRKTAPLILSDGQRTQEVAIGAVGHQRSASLTASEPYQADRAIHSYHEDSSYRTVPELIGAESIAASSSQADVDAFPFPRADRGVWAAFDHDDSTLWSSDPGSSDTESWVELAFGERRDVGTVAITIDVPEGGTRQLRVTTEEGTATVNARSGIPVEVPIGRVNTLRVSGPSAPGDPLRIVDVTMSAVEVSRPLALPTVGEGLPDPSAILISREVQLADGCLEFAGTEQCRISAQVRSEEGRVLDRLVTLRHAADVTAYVEASPVGGDALDQLMQQGLPIAAAVSSHGSTAPQAGAASLLDGDLGTGWIAAEDDTEPTVTITWAVEQQVSQIRWDTADLAATSPQSAHIELSDGSAYDVDLSRGSARFPATNASWMRVSLQASDRATSVNDDGGFEELPIGLAEIEIPGVTTTGVEPSLEEESFGCGSGPTLTVNGRMIQSEVIASRAQLRSGQLSAVRLCDASPIHLSADSNRITVAGTGAIAATAVLLIDDDGEFSDAATSSEATSHAPSALVETHNVNAGWVAEQGSKKLTPVVLNGWQQGWALHDDHSTVVRSFAPDRLYRAGLIGGALAALLLGALCWRWSTREGALPAADGGPAKTPRLAAQARTALGWGTAVASAGLLGGWIGLLASALGILLGWIVLPGRVALAPYVAGAVTLAGGLAYVLSPWADSGGWAGTRAWPQVMVLLLVGLWLAPWCRLPRRWTRSMAGFSTRR